MATSFNMERYNKIEFRLITGLFLIIIFNTATYVSTADEWAYIDSDISYQSGNFMLVFMRCTSLYLAYLVALFVLIKGSANNTGNHKIRNFLISSGLFTGLVIAWTLAKIWTDYSFYYFFADFKDNTSVALGLLLRNFLKITIISSLYYVYTQLKQNDFVLNTFTKIKSDLKAVLVDCAIILYMWAAIFLLLSNPEFRTHYKIIWSFLAFPAIPLYAWSSVILIPFVKRKQKGFWYYWLMAKLVAIATALIIFFFFVFILKHHSGQKTLFIIIAGYVWFQLIVTVTLAWHIYQYRLSKNAEITGLKTALGQSSANLDFLRSQINPHFLFNALNTLYGTAIQENAERTCEGIQKLGDMMRFMLDENTQEKISLMREVDYLKNYIDLQKLRTHTSPDIVIQTEIEESITGLQIAPMLLIPFVENAFKHGISLREASYIKITLHTEGNKLFFDVHNTVHIKAGTDPEKNNTGIGLENVKQRLQLLYPKRNELMIRKTAKEYFAHLTVEL